MIKPLCDLLTIRDAKVCPYVCIVVVVHVTLKQLSQFILVLCFCTMIRNLC